MKYENDMKNKSRKEYYELLIISKSRDRIVFEATEKQVNYWNKRWRKLIILIYKLILLSKYRSDILS